MLFHTVITVRQSDVFFLYNNAAFTRFLIVLFLRVFGKKVVLELNEYPFSPEGDRITQIPGVRTLMRLFVFYFIMIEMRKAKFLFILVLCPTTRLPSGEDASLLHLPERRTRQRSDGESLEGPGKEEGANEAGGAGLVPRL